LVLDSVMLVRLMALSRAFDSAWIQMP